MRFAVVWLLALVLAGCGEQQAPTSEGSKSAGRLEAADWPAPPPLPSLDWRRIIHPPPHTSIPLVPAHPDPDPELPVALLLRPGYSAAVRIEPSTPAAVPVDPHGAATRLPGSRASSSVLRPGAADTPSLVIIIDDVGHGLAQGRRVIGLPAPVVLAILPHTQAAQRLADEARQAGKSVMLHLPMENQGGTSIGPGGLYARMSEAEFQRVLVENLDSLAGIQGVNNHMGSLLTTLRPQMDWLMQELDARGLFFVDSRTSAQTQAAQAAAARGIPHLSRHVFLDNLRTPEHLALSFDRAIAQARREGHAVLIGHPYPETLTFLERRLPGLEEREGVRVVPVETLLDGR